MSALGKLDAPSWAPLACGTVVVPSLSLQLIRTAAAGAEEGPAPLGLSELRRDERRRRRDDE